jgi:hypothetical protein
VLDNEHSLHLWKRHPCTSTVERQLTDWREQVIQYDVTCMGSCIVTGILCLFIQSNYIELQASINILIWVAWLFNHPVVSPSSTHKHCCPKTIVTGIWGSGGGDSVDGGILGCGPCGHQGSSETLVAMYRITRRSNAENYDQHYFCVCSPQMHAALPNNWDALLWPCSTSIPLTHITRALDLISK